MWVDGHVGHEFDLERLSGAASSQGSAKSQLFLEDMIQMGEDVYAKRNQRVTQIMQLPMKDWMKALYVFLRGDTPFAQPAGMVLQLSAAEPV